MSRKFGIQLKTNKTLQKLWHPESGLVFHSKDNKVVIGQCIDDKLVPLTEETIEVCKKWKFSFDKTFLEKESENEHYILNIVSNWSMKKMRKNSKN